MKELSNPTAFRHHELRSELEQLRLWADEIGIVPRATVQRRLDAANELLMARLLPHALAEEETLYPAVKRFVGAHAIEMLQRDHGEMMKLTAELNALRRAVCADEIGPRFAIEARRILYGLSVLAELHFEKEEEIVFPVLDSRCTLAETANLGSAMERAAARINAEA
jgi:iron-sulfur cluster repair protein YtfE (RIC family)